MRQPTHHTKEHSVVKKYITGRQLLALVELVWRPHYGDDHELAIQVDNFMAVFA